MTATLARLLLWFGALLGLGLICWAFALAVDWPPAAALWLWAGIVAGVLWLRWARRSGASWRTRWRTRTAAVAAACPPWQRALQARQQLLARRPRGDRRRLRAQPFWLLLGAAQADGETLLDQWGADRDPAGCRQSPRLLAAAVGCDEPSPSATARWPWPRDDRCDGVVIVLAAAALQQAAADEAGARALIRLAEQMRAQRLALADAVGFAAPVQLWITQCERIAGFVAFAQSLDPALRVQPFGSGFAPDALPALRLRQTFDALTSAVRPHWHAAIASGVSAPDLLTWLGQWQALQEPLEAFVTTCFGPQPEQPTPCWQGLFFCGEGGGGEPAAPSYFVDGLFAKLLPTAHGGQWLPGHRWRHWLGQRGVALTATAAAIASGIALGSAAGDAALLRQLAALADSGPLQVRASAAATPEARLQSLQRLHDALSAIALRRHSVLSGWVSGAQLRRLEQLLAQRYRQQFDLALGSVEVAFAVDDPAVQQPSDDAVAAPAAELEAAARRSSRHTLNAIRAVNLVRGREAGAGVDALDALPQPLADDVPIDAQQRNNALAVAYLASLAPDSAQLGALRQRLQRRVIQALDTEPNWALALVDDPNAGEAPVAAVTLQTFGLQPSPTARIAPAQTRTGILRAQAYLDEAAASVASVVAFRPRFDRQRDQWLERLQQARLVVWQRFVGDFIAAASVQRDEASARSAVVALNADDSPALDLLQQLADEFVDLPQPPRWVRRTRALAVLARAAQAQSHRHGWRQQAASYLDTVNTVGGQALRQAFGGAPLQAGQTVDSYLRRLQAVTAYLAQTRALASAATSGAAGAYQLAADFVRYGRDPSVKASVAAAAQAALQRMRSDVVEAANQDTAEDAEEDALWRLLALPLDATLRYALMQASCVVQQAWQADVLWAQQTAAGEADADIRLFGEQGSFWAFVGGVAKPFLQRDERRYQPVVIAGRGLPFADSFLGVLNAAASRQAAQRRHAQQLQQLQADEQAVANAAQQVAAFAQLPLLLTVTTRPLRANATAKADPYAAELALQCAAGKQQLSNFNFPVTKALHWVPGQCADLTLTIKVGMLVLTKRYPGECGIDDFLRDFASGTKRFVVADFPAQKTRWAALQIDWIDVGYAFDGVDGIHAAADALRTLRRLQQQVRTLQQATRADGEEGGVAGPGVAPASLGLPPRAAQCWQVEGRFDGADGSSVVADH